MPSQWELQGRDRLGSCNMRPRIAFGAMEAESSGRSQGRLTPDSAVESICLPIRSGPHAVAYVPQQTQ